MTAAKGTTTKTASTSTRTTKAATTKAGTTKAGTTKAGTTKAGTTKAANGSSKNGTSRRKVRLRHVDPKVKGIRRHRKGDSFRYIDPDGKTVSGDRRKWIESLAIPPAWTKVWISPYENGHVLAYGFDDRGRKQYIYHPDWRTARDEDKFDRLVRFARRLPTLRSDVRADLRRDGIDRERVVAAVVRTLDLTFLRVGSDTYARENGSYGIATLRRRHIEEEDRDHLRLRFTAKGGKESEVDLQDRRVVEVVRDCSELPGQRLFVYQDEEGRSHHVTSGDVNGYVREAMGEGFTSKDFRTWGATVLMTTFLRARRHVEDPKEREAVVRDAVTAVAERLGNTPAICKKSYLHPAVPAAFLDGSLWERARGGRMEGLWPEETATLRVLESYLH